MRAEVDRVDDALLGLLRERAALARRFGALKRELDLPALDPAREEALLARLAAAAGPELDEAASRRVFAAVLAECRALVVRAREDP
ncbi:MAG: chorismate mutase [Planctomycetota bacterium]